MDEGLTLIVLQMNMDEVGDAIPEVGGADANDKSDSSAGIIDLPMP